MILHMLALLWMIEMSPLEVMDSHLNATSHIHLVSQLQEPIVQPFEKPLEQTLEQKLVLDMMPPILAAMLEAMEAMAAVAEVMDVAAVMAAVEVMAAAAAADLVITLRLWWRRLVSIFWGKT